MKTRAIAVLLAVLACPAAGDGLRLGSSPAVASETDRNGRQPSVPDAQRTAPEPEKKPAEPPPPAKPAEPPPAADSPSPVAPAPEPSLDIPERPKFEELPNLFTQTAAKGPDEAVTTFSIEALESYVVFFPARSTRIGVRTFDMNLGDYRKASVDAFVGSNKGYLQALQKISTAGLTEKGRLELESLRVHLRSVIRYTDTLGAPQRDPNFYIDESVGAINELLEHDESQAIEKVPHVLARLTIVPKFLELARQNLTTCSKPAVRRAIVRLRAAEPIFVSQLPAGFRGAGTPGTGKAGTDATAAAWRAIASFADWLQAEKLPAATDPAPLGDAGWRAWLLSREDADLDPDRVLSAAEADLAKLEDELKKEAARLAPDKTPAVLVGEIASERMEPDAARKEAEYKIIPGLWEWMIHDRPLNPPSADVIVVRETPTYRRREAPLRADFPGGYATEGAPAFLEIAAPNPDWPAPRMLSWISAYGKSFIRGALAREVYPGRFVAYQRARVAKTRANRALDFPTMTGGWGLYAEELALRRGYASSEAKVRIAMLVDLIRADARLIASVRVHAKGMTSAAASEWLRTKSYWSRPEADEEAERILVDPDVAAPPLGRLAILALREDVKRAKGTAFVDLEFHDRFISYGAAPISAIRRAMLPDGAGALLGPGKPSQKAPAAPPASSSLIPTGHSS